MGVKRFFLFLITLFFSISSWGQSASLIGYTALSKKVFSRIFEQKKNISLVNLYYFKETPLSFEEFLGVYDSSPDADQIKNGHPNAFNFILLGILADNIAATVASECSEGGILVIHSGYRSQYVVLQPDLKSPLKPIVEKICRWPLTVEQTNQSMKELFDRIAMFDFPESEYHNWTDHFSNPIYKNKTGQEVLYDMVYALFMNPYFLLKQ